MEDGGVDATRLKFNVVQFPKAAHQVGPTPIDSVLRENNDRGGCNHIMHGRRLRPS